MRQEPAEQPPIPTRGERRGAAFAHASALLIAVPLVATRFLPPDLALVPCPVVAYLISRSFRRRGQGWGAFQGLQAAVVQLLLVVLFFTFRLVLPLPVTFLAAVVSLSGMLLFIYTLWGAWECLFGINFRYLIIGPYLERISYINMRFRTERRRQWLGQLEEPPRDRDNPNRPG